MARTVQWLGKDISLDANLADQGGVELISESQMDEIGACTVERVQIWLHMRNGATASNRIAVGLIATDGRTSVTDYPPPMTATAQSLSWMWTDHYAFDTASAEADPQVFGHADIRTKRKLKRGMVLQLVMDDVQGDYDLIGGYARILIRLG